MSPTAGWTATAICRAPGSSRRCFDPAARSHPSPTRREGKNKSSTRPEHELAVAFKERAGPHVELSVMADEEQRALGHLLGDLQQQAGIVGAHLVGKCLTLLVVAIAHVRRQHPGRRRSTLRECGCRQRGQRGCHQEGLGRKSRHPACSQQPVRKSLASANFLNKSRTSMCRQRRVYSTQAASFKTL